MLLLQNFPLVVHHQQHPFVLKGVAQTPPFFIISYTLQKLEVCAQQNVPAKRFKICYILCIRKPM